MVSGGKVVVPKMEPKTVNGHVLKMNLELEIATNIILVKTVCNVNGMLEILK